MKGIFWVIVVVLVVLVGVLLLNFAQERRKQANFVFFEVGPDSVRAFMERIEELERTASRIRSRMDMAPPLERAQLSRRLAILEEEIRDLKVAVEQWRSAREKKSIADLYYKCIMLYGKAAGVCELLASDTLPPVRPQE